MIASCQPSIHGSHIKLPPSQHKVLRDDLPLVKSMCSHA